MRKRNSSRGITKAGPKGFPGSPYRIPALIVIFSAYVMLLWLVSRPVFAQIVLRSVSEKSVASAVLYDAGNATYHFVLGRLYYSRGDKAALNRAIQSYRNSLRISPLQGGCWLDLAKAYQTSGMIGEAEYAVKRATALLPSNPLVRWEAGVFSLINGDLEQSMDNLKAFLLLQPDRQEEVYDLVWKIPLDPRYILENLVPEEYPYYKQYLIYLISANRVNASGALWQRMKSLEIESGVVVRYLDFLISGRYYREGELVWKDYLEGTNPEREPDEANMPRNGSFEYDILNGGFDWKVREAQGVDVFIDKDVHMLGERSLGITFDGTANPGIVIASQVVRVLPKTHYELRANIKSDSLTTKNGVILAVEGHDCRSLSKRSEVITGTNFWSEVGLKFNVPSECSAVLIKIQRDKSQKLDNRISGTAWIDGVTLVQR